jgi:hypothetical protein
MSNVSTNSTSTKKSFLGEVSIFKKVVIFFFTVFLICDAYFLYYINTNETIESILRLTGMLSIILQVALVVSMINVVGLAYRVMFSATHSDFSGESITLTIGITVILINLYLIPDAYSVNIVESISFLFNK